MDGAMLPSQLALAVSYKQDLRGSSAVEIIAELVRRGARVSYFDPLVPEVPVPGGGMTYRFEVAKHRQVV
jgi:UDP-N-acetyl-D-mannosaminuronate dehydrogenase